ncbi:MAG: prepilin-type N-terminal cleavage/methylation domain-containing protein [bacterium]|nr:prepilin-type N-terminal cleavage/methylation domain-containing protein [bacterium]
MKGFTLIETIIYIALLGLIMGGTLTAVFQLLESGVSLNYKTVVHSEVNFVLRKINWAFSNASYATRINPQFLQIYRYDGTEIDFCLDSSNPSKKIIKIRRGVVGPLVCTDVAFVPLTTSNVLVNDLTFSQISAHPIGIKTDIDVNGFNFTLSKYIRK